MSSNLAEPPVPAGVRWYVCPALQPPLDGWPDPECDRHTTCDRCDRPVCPDHGDDDYAECDVTGIYCRPCHEETCPLPDCWWEG